MESFSPVPGPPAKGRSPRSGEDGGAAWLAFMGDEGRAPIPRALAEMCCPRFYLCHLCGAKRHLCHLCSSFQSLNLPLPPQDPKKVCGSSPLALSFRCRKMPQSAAPMAPANRESG